MALTAELAVKHSLYEKHTNFSSGLIDYLVQNSELFVSVFHKKSFKTLYEIHHSEGRFLMKSMYGIEVFKRPRIIRLLNEMKDQVSKNNNLGICLEVEV